MAALISSPERGDSGATVLARNHNSSIGILLGLGSIDVHRNGLRLCTFSSALAALPLLHSAKVGTLGDSVVISRTTITTLSTARSVTTATAGASSSRSLIGRYISRIRRRLRRCRGRGGFRWSGSWRVRRDDIRWSLEACRASSIPGFQIEPTGITNRGALRGSPPQWRSSGSAVANP